MPRRGPAWASACSVAVNSRCSIDGRRSSTCRNRSTSTASSPMPITSDLGWWLLGRWRRGRPPARTYRTMPKMSAPRPRMSTGAPMASCLVASLLQALILGSSGASNVTFATKASPATAASTFAAAPASPVAMNALAFGVRTASTPSVWVIFFFTACLSLTAISATRSTRIALSVGIVAHHLEQRRPADPLARSDDQEPAGEGRQYADHGHDRPLRTPTHAWRTPFPIAKRQRLRGRRYSTVTVLARLRGLSTSRPWALASA